MNSLKTNEKQPSITPPGELITEYLKVIGMTQMELAERMGRGKWRINEMIKGKEPISMTKAFELETILGVPAKFWLRKEQDYRIALFKLKQIEDHEKWLDWLRKFPLKELKKRGYLKGVTKNNMSNLLSFFQVSQPEHWFAIFLTDNKSNVFRANLVKLDHPESVSAWLRIGEIESSNVSIKPFDIVKFKKSLLKLKRLIFANTEDLAEKLQKICADSGIVLVFVDKLENSELTACTRWYKDKPVIQLSYNFSSFHDFVFTFFQQIAHVLMLNKKDIFFYGTKKIKQNLKKIRQAEFFAEQSLNLNDIMSIAETKNYSSDYLIQLSKDTQTPIELIYGELYRRKFVSLKIWKSYLKDYTITS